MIGADRLAAVVQAFARFGEWQPLDHHLHDIEFARLGSAALQIVRRVRGAAI